MDPYEFHRLTHRYVPLSPLDFHILFCLMLHQRHAYAIMQYIDFDSGGLLEPNPSTVYDAIRRLYKLKLIMRGERRAWLYQTKQRQYYHITELGKLVLARHFKWMSDMQRLAKQRQYFAEDM